jgi:hypothetical protein
MLHTATHIKTTNQVMNVWTTRILGTTQASFQDACVVYITNIIISIMHAHSPQKELTVTT